MSADIRHWPGGMTFVTAVTHGRLFRQGRAGRRISGVTNQSCPIEPARQPEVDGGGHQPGLGIPDPKA